MKPKEPRDDRPPVYYAACRLYQQFARSTKKSPINIKRGILAEVERLIQSIIEDTAFANELETDPAARLKWIAAALEKMNRVKISVRMIKDLQYIKPKGFSAIMNAEEKVTRQLQGWRRSTVKNA